MSKQKKPDLLSSLPRLVQDTRFRAGRQLMQASQTEQAVTLFAILLEDAIAKYGDSHMETAPLYYEYGNALLRTADRKNNDEEGKSDETENNDNPREAAARAAEARMKQESSKETTSNTPATEDSERNEKDDSSKNDDDDDDRQLALEMMETAFAIVDENNDELYPDWCQNERPRILTGIGDALSSLGKHADACDAYIRALSDREEQVKRHDKSSSESIELLQARRKLSEILILIAQELLDCPDDDVVTSETKECLVPKAERIDYARGYYDKARDELQEALVLMGKMAAQHMSIETENEDICFLSTIVMAVGIKLAELVEDGAETFSTEAKEPAQKKPKV